MSEESIRLQKYLSLCGVASRRHAEDLIRKGIVEVNGQTITKMGAKVNPSSDRVFVRQKEVKPRASGALILNKPRAVITSMQDPAGRKTVAELLPPEALGFFPVGRLDYQSSGLLIFTNDGDLASRLTHPRYQCERVYEAKVAGHPGEEVFSKVASGIRLEDGLARADLSLLGSDTNSTWLRISIFEGRNRIIRRIMSAVGFPVKKLHRLSHGPVALGGLASGQLRFLSDREFQKLKSIVFSSSDDEPSRSFV